VHWLASKYVCPAFEIIEEPGTSSSYRVPITFAHFLLVATLRLMKEWMAA
jgi:hypothetical protein